MWTPAVRSFCQCEILLIPPHFLQGGACNDSVLVGGSKCHLSYPPLTYTGVLCTAFCSIRTIGKRRKLAMWQNTHMVRLF